MPDDRTMNELSAAAEQRVLNLRILLAELRIRAHRTGPDAEVLTEAGNVVEWLLDDLTINADASDDCN